MILFSIRVEGPTPTFARLGDGMMDLAMSEADDQVGLEDVVLPHVNGVILTFSNGGEVFT